jgi:NAD(P)-dependent dehydrogenase (short-subunit alcohol dehydrogenase family)
MNPLVLVASKVAVIQLTRVTAIELCSVGTHVIAVCPGFIGTSIVNRVCPSICLAEIKQWCLGNDEEVAEMVAYLTSNNHCGTTGCYYVLDDGMSACLL